MASIAMTVSPCPPRESLKRNRMHGGAMEAAYPGLSDDAPRLMKRRCFEHDSIMAAAADDNVPKYSQRQFEYLEQVKQAELSRLKAEFEQVVVKKEKDMQQMREEYDRLRDICMNQAKEMEKMQGENKILRRAVAIQNQQKEEATQENNMLKQLAQQAAEHIKRLEQTNYALRVHLQTSTGGPAASNFISPDVY